MEEPRSDLYFLLEISFALDSLPHRTRRLLHEPTVRGLSLIRFAQPILDQSDLSSLLATLGLFPPPCPLPPPPPPPPLQAACPSNRRSRSASPESSTSSPPSPPRTSPRPSSTSQARTAKALLPRTSLPSSLLPGSKSAGLIALSWSRSAIVLRLGGGR